MKKYLFIGTLFGLLVASLCTAAEFETTASFDSKHPFYRGNGLYGKGDYTGALKEYSSIKELGFESGNLYYNLGNTYFKLGKLGYAILYYERAKRLLPGDPDVLSNLKLARSLIQENGQTPSVARWAYILDHASQRLTLTRLAIAVSTIYYGIIILLILSVVIPRSRRYSAAAALLLAPLLLVGAASFFWRCYHTERLRPSIIIAKEGACKFEPFEKATTFFTLNEGAKIYVLKSKRRWSYIRRADGKKGWIQKELYEEI